MNRNEIEKIIHIENLRHYNWFQDNSIRPNEVGIKENNGRWFVYTSDERANPITEKEFNTEYEALENFLKRLRALNKYLE